ncbi:uncharacterized protein LOC109854501 [Pseudomyrmex gracilis]|uniref:uncharacterized protein LOC109854501 n=1 Tax=Pseudomyrmex gracilis TaxID=219809 RepID=UPI000995BE69|nr:uncharacterized protein LOC109854501 [Pseudomyrmex gracilis]
MRVCIMVRFKMLFALFFCILLIGHHAQAVVNKAASQVTKEEEKLRTKADDRISNSFESPSDAYGPPLGNGFKGPAPVYGPPELVGDHGPTPIYPPPPPELPPPIFGPPPASYGPPKQSFGGLPLLPKLTYGPPKLHYGLLKQHFTSPSGSFGLFRSPKPHYGPPLKLIGTPSSQPLKPGHGPPIPLSLETYGPPPPKLAIQFNPLPDDEYGPPPPPVSEPQPQYGPPAVDIYGPPPPAPPPGVPAPPTPPDIKYDGWQPIAGLPAPANNQSPPTDAYGPPVIDGKQNHIEGSSSTGTQLSHASLNISPNVPSDSYGAPIRNPEDQNLKTSVHESSSENNGLPPPPLPQHEPLHNQGQAAVTVTTDHKSDRHQQLNSQYGTPSNALPDLNGNFYFKQLENILLHHSESADGGTHAPTSNAGNSHDFQNLGNDDLSVQQLPLLQKQPLEDYNVPSLAINLENPLTDGSLIPPPPLNTYNVPLSSYSSNGPYPNAQSGRSPFPSFGQHLFYKQGAPHHHKLPGPGFRPPPILFNSLTPPQNREPIKFREPIPTRLLTNIHKYLPPVAKQHLPSVHAPVSFRHASGAGNSFASGGSTFASAASLFNEHNSAIAAPHVQYGTPLSFTAFNAQTPHLTYGAPNFGPPTSFVSTSSSEFGSNNLYGGIDNVLTTTYGTPVVPFSINGGGNCDSSQPLSANGALPSASGLSSTGQLHSSGELHLNGGLSSGGELPSSGQLSLGNGLLAHEGARQQHSVDQPSRLDFKTTEIALGNAENLSSDFANSLAASFAETDLSSSLPLAKPLDNFLGGPPVNTLDLQHDEQQKTNLKDSYGNPVGLTYDSSNEASNSKIRTSVADVTNELSSSQSYSAEAFTASLTAQGLNQEKNLDSNELDANQFLKTNNEALSLAQHLTSSGDDGFEIQGSKGIYKLQIHPANGELNTENSDGSIRHDQVLSNGLLQNILAAIEQPENGAIELQGPPQAQQLEKVFGPDLQRTDAVNGHFITVDSQAQSNERIEKIDDRRANEKYLQSLPPVALFFDTKYATKEIRSVRPKKSEKQLTRGDQQIYGSGANLA